MSRGALIVIIVGIIGAIATGIVATTTGEWQLDVSEDGNATEGRHLTLDLDESLVLKENP